MGSETTNTSSNGSSARKGGAGRTMRASNPPNKNGNGEGWENFGTVFLDATGKRGTLYFDATVEQLQALLATAKEGRVQKKIALHAREQAPKAAGAPPAAA